MKKIILILILMLNIGGFIEVDNKNLGNSVSAQFWPFKKKGIPCPNDPTSVPSQGILTRTWHWLISLFPGKEDRVQEIEQIATGCEYDNTETYSNTYTTFNYYNFDWYITDDDGERLYYNPGGGGDFTIGEIDILSRLGQYAAEFFVLNPELDLGTNTNDHYLTVNGSSVKYYNNSNIVLQNYGNASVNIKIHGNDNAHQGPSIPSETIDDPNPSSEFYEWYVNNQFMGGFPELNINPGTAPTHIKVKKSTGEVVLNATIKKKDIGIANNSGNNTYVSPDGIPFTLPANSKIVTYNIDTDNFTNGSLYGFITSDGKEFIFKDENSFKGTSGTPKYTTAVRINDNGGARTYTTETFTGFTYPARNNGPIEVTRVRKVKENGICKLLLEKVSYTVPPDVANTISGTVRPQNTAIEDAPVIALISSNIIDCPDNSTGYIDNAAILKNYMKSKKQEVSSFLNNKVKNNIKIYLAETEYSNVTHTINKTGSKDLNETEQSGETDKFDNGNFTAADEDIAIKMYLKDGKWEYEVKFNENKLDPDAKVAPVLQQVKNEIKRQADDEVRKLRVPESESDAVEQPVEGGEKFAKAKMDMLQAIAAIYDIGKEIINEGKMPENIWDNGKRSAGTDQAVKDDYNNSAFNAPSLISGAADQLIDEATGAIQLVKTGLEIVRKPVESAKGLWNTVKNLDKDKIKQFAADASGITNYQLGGSPAIYQGGKHGVQAAMIIAGSLKLLTNGKEILEEGSKEINEIQKFIPDGTTGHPAADALKNAAENNKVVKNIENEKLLTENIVNGERKTVAIDKNGEVFETKALNNVDNLDPEVLKYADASELAEAADDIIAHDQMKNHIINFINGKKFEKRITEDPSTITSVGNKAGINLSTYDRKLTQVQLKTSSGDYFIADEVYIKYNNTTGKYDVVINEIKIDDGTPFTKRQNEFLRDLRNGQVEFELRNIKYDGTQGNPNIPQGSIFNIKSMIKTAGDGTVNSSPTFSKFDPSNNTWN